MTDLSKRMELDFAASVESEAGLDLVSVFRAGPKSVIEAKLERDLLFRGKEAMREAVLRFDLFEFAVAETALDVFALEAAESSEFAISVFVPANHWAIASEVISRSDAASTTLTHPGAFISGVAEFGCIFSVSVPRSPGKDSFR